MEGNGGVAFSLEPVIKLTPGKTWRRPGVRWGRGEEGGLRSWYGEGGVLSVVWGGVHRKPFGEGVEKE